MGHYYSMVSSGDDAMVYIQKSVTLLTTAVSEATAETFTTGTGKLATPDNATAYPAFNSDEIVWVDVVALGDYEVVVKRGSEAIDSGTGAFSFAVYISSTYVEHSEGTYKFNVLIHRSQ